MTVSVQGAALHQSCAMDIFSGNNAVLSISTIYCLLKLSCGAEHSLRRCTHTHALHIFHSSYFQGGANVSICSASVAVPTLSAALACRVEGTFFWECFVDNKRLFSDCFALFYPVFKQPAFYLRDFSFHLLCSCWNTWMWECGQKEEHGQ